MPLVHIFIAMATACLVLSTVSIGYALYKGFKKENKSAEAGLNFAFSAAYCGYGFLFAALFGLIFI